MPRILRGAALQAYAEKIISREPPGSQLAVMLQQALVLGRLERDDVDVHVPCTCGVLNPEGVKCPNCN